MVDRLVKNPSIDGKGAMLSRVKVVNEISRVVFNNKDIDIAKPWIYQGIIDYYKENEKADTNERKLNEQIKEEYEKAIIIVKMSEQNNTSGNKKMEKWGDCEKAFKEAEVKEVCKGSIRFLYRNADGNLPYDNQNLSLPKINDNFVNKIDMVNQLDALKDLKDSEDKKTEAWVKYIQKILGEYASQKEPFKEIENKFLFTSKLYDDRSACWKYDILCNSDMSEQVDEFLRWDGNSEQTGNASQQANDDWQKPKKDYDSKQEYKAIANFKMSKRCIDMGMARNKASLHMVFTGNPGTAKTTVARLFAEILKDEKVLSTGRFVEVGSAAINVKEKFKEAKGGVLFIDEAYSLCEYHKGSFGDEAITTIVNEMENHRDDVIVIFAGYPAEMEEFLDRNSGLRSRIAFHIEFEDYTTDELCDITRLKVSNMGMTITDAAMEKLRGIYEEARKSTDFGNGRFVRKLLEEAEMNIAERLVDLDESELKPEMLTTIDAGDISKPNLKNREEKCTIGFAV